MSPRAALLSWILFVTGTVSAADLPSPQALGPWVDTGWADSSTDVVKYPSTPVRCSGRYLFPSHPQQELKVYHRYLEAAYDAQRLSGSDRACLIHQNGKNSQGEVSCLRADLASDVVLSDVYEDACGNLYRAFVERRFLNQDENMGTLFSPGRAMYPDPRSENPNQMIPGGTYAVPVHDFLKIGPLFSGDPLRVRELRNQALKIFRYDPLSHLYVELNH